MDPLLERAEVQPVLRYDDDLAIEHDL